MFANFDAPKWATKEKNSEFHFLSHAAFARIEIHVWCSYDEASDVSEQQRWAVRVVDGCALLSSPYPAVAHKMSI